MKNCIYLIFFYSYKAWILYNALKEKIVIFEMWCIRHLGNISWKAKLTSKEVLSKMKLKWALLKNIISRKIRYSRHIKRRNKILTTRIQGRRLRGCLINNWFWDIRYWLGQSDNEACSRHLWCIILHRPSTRRSYPHIIRAMFKLLNIYMKNIFKANNNALCKFLD